MLPNATTEILSQMAAQRRQMYLNNINAEHTAYHHLNDVYHGKEDIAHILPVRPREDGLSNWVTRNRKGINPFRRGIERLTSPLTRAEMQWTGDEKWNEADKETYKPLLLRLTSLRGELVQTMALHGRAGIFPWRDQNSKLRITALTQFIFPIKDDFESNVFETIIMFQQYQAVNGTEYMVWEFTQGTMNLWRSPSVTEFSTRGAKETYPQGHAANRLPIAFNVLLRTADGDSEGIGAAGLAAQEKYVQRLIQENASYERAGHPQRIARGVSPQDEVDSFRAYDVIRLTKA
ncbi:MAG: hypothetical protein ACRCZG_01385, partial [Culicoidibacterales bacterium]